MVKSGAVVFSSIALSNMMPGVRVVQRVRKDLIDHFVLIHVRMFRVVRYSGKLT